MESTPSGPVSYTHLGIYFKDGNVDSFSVDFENGDFDEFYGESIGKRFFLTKEAADEAFVKGE